MSQHNFRKKVAETCRFWREGKCQKREYQCNFVHGFICPNDGRCWKEHCNKVHLQKKIMPPRDYFPKAHMNYQRPGPRQRFRRSHSRSLSPQRHRKVPQRGRSPLRRRSRSRSPTYHTRVYSPYQRRSRSPSPYRGGRRSRSRTPSPIRGVRRSRSRSLSPMRGARRSRSRSWSPSRGVRKSRSRSLSPLRSIRRSRSRSQSPLRGQRRGASPLRRRTRSRSRSGSWRRSRSLSASRPRSRNRSQGKIMSRSPSPIRSRSKSRGVGKLYSRSPSPEPKRRSRSSTSNSSSGSSQSNKRSPSRTFSHSHTENSTPSSLKDKNLKPVQTKSNNPVPEITDGGGSTPQRNSGNAGRRMQLDLENLYDNLECETSQKSAASETLDKEAAEKEAISKLQAQFAKDFMNPETQKLMEKVLSLTKENTINSLQPEESKSKKEFFLDEVGDDIELDLEEVGEEVDDIFTKSLNRSVDESNEDSFDKGSNRNIGLQIGSNPSPPKSRPVSKPEKSSDFDETDFHSDWDLKTALETASKSLKKPRPMPPPNQQAEGSKTGSTSLWTPALIRNQPPGSKTRVGYLPQDSDWEVDTPYVGRKDKGEMQRPAAQSKTVKNEQQACDVSPAAPFVVPEAEPLNTHRGSYKPVEMTQEKKEKFAHQKDALFPSAQSAVSNIPTQVSNVFNQPGVTSTGMMPPGAADFMRDGTKERESYYSPKEHATAPPKVAEDQTPSKSSESPKRYRKRHKEKKPKRKKDSSDDDSDSSESDDSSEDKKLPQEKEKDTDELEVLLFKKESLMKRVKLLMEQKAMMSSQREDIIKNHKGSKTNLASILKENSFLIKEIGKQIGNIGNIVKSINHDIEVKRGNLKQTSSAPKGRSESPHVSRETHKARYSAEKEKLGKKLLKPIERQETWSRDSDSRSPKGGLRRKRSESPSPSMSREGPKPAPPERKQSASPPRKRPVKSTLEGSKKPAGHQPSQYAASKNTEQVHYAPHEAQRTYIRYMDQGMHWCKLCSLFCETALEYVDHLMTESHLGRVKNDRKSWLCRASKEEKEPKPFNAQVVTVPIQGMEFLHSLTSFYCSLCDTFMRDKGEALRHPESKMHVSKYKIHRAQNPLFESTFLKAKTTAYAKYKVDEERKKMENELNLNEKTVSLENKLLKQIKEKYEKESKEERQSDSQDDSGRNCGSIRVASRGPRHSSDKKPSKGSDDSRRKSDSLRHSNDEPQTSQKYEPKESEGGSNVDNVGGHEKTSIEDQRESKYKEGSKDVDADRKPVSSKLPLIGKMPFLKRKSGMTKNKEQQSTPVEEQPKLKKESSEEFNLSEIIPLPKPEARDSDVRKSSQKVEEIKKPLTVKPVAKEKPLTVKPVAKEKPLTVKPVAPPVECPVTSVVSEDKTMMKNIPDAPLLLDTEKTSETEEKDTHGSDLYDPLEAGDEDSSDGAAAATIEALDLLNIPLPGFKTSLDSQKTSSTPPLSETEDKYQPEDMEIESTPLILEEEGMEEGKICPLETVHPPAGMIVHPGISLMAPPPVNLSNPPLHMNLSNPPPINLNNPPPPINLNNPPPPINLSTPPPPINLNPPPPMNLNNPPPPINLSNPLPINLNTPPPPISLSNTLPLMSLNNLPPPRSSSDPPPPGTEEPAFSSRDEGNNIIPTGNVLPAFGPQEFIAKSTPPPIDIQRQNDSQIPLPPGTEDEHTTREIPTLSYSSGKLEDKVDEVDTQRQPLQLFSPKGNSMDVPLSLSDNVIKGSLKSTKEPSKTPQRNKNLPHDREKESTPPPPGTEGFSSEADSHDSNESNKLSTSDLESLKSLSVSSDLEIHANKEKLKLSQESKSSPNVSKAESSSSNLQSNPDQFSDSESGVSENVQQDEKDSSGKCLTSDTRHEELGSYPAKDVRSHSLSPKASDKGNVATSHGGMEKNSCTPSKEPDKESITTAHSSTEERSRTPPREPDLVKDEAALDYKNEKSCSTLPPTELDPENVFSSNRIQEGPLTLPTKEIDTEKIATPCESQEWSHKPQDQHSTVKSKEVASLAIMSESYTLPLKQSDTENIAPPCGSEEQLHTPITKQPDIGNIAPSCGSEEQLHTPLTKQPDIGNIAPPCGSEEQLHTPQTEQLDTGNIAPPCDSVEQLHTPLTKQPDTGNIAPPCGSEGQLHTPITEQSDTEDIAPPCESEEQLHTLLTEQPDTGNIAPPCDNVEQLHTLLTEQPDTGNIAPPCDNVEQLHTPLTEQPDTGNIAPPCDSVEQLHTPITEQPDTGNIAPPCDSEEQLHTPITEQLDTGNIAPPCDSVEQLHTPLTKQPDTGNIAPPCDSVEQLHTPLTKQPDTGNIAPPFGSEGQLHTPITEQPDTEDIAPPCESEEQLHTLLTEQPDIGDISPPSDSEGQLHTPQTEQPDTGDIAPTCESEERPHTAQTEEPDVGDKTISAATNEERPFTHPPEILTALHGSDNKRSCTSPDLQPSTRNITASHDNERNICTSPSLQLNTRISTMAPGSDEERSCATPLTQLDAGSQVTSQNVLLPQLDRDLSYPEGNSAVEFSTWTRLMEKNELTESKMTPSDNENFNKNPSSQSSTVDTDDNKNKQDTSSEDEGESIEDRSHALSSKQHDTGNIPSSSKLSVNQESAESLVSEEWRLNVQDSNSLSILKDSTQDSTECCDIMIERNLTQKSDVIDKPESPVMKPKSPVQMINFHKSFESMDIAELYLPSRSDSVCTQSINPSKFVSPHTGDKGTSDTVKNVSDMYEENSETIEGEIDDEQGINNEMDKKNQDSGVRIEETKSVRDTSCGQSKEPLREELETSTVECSDSSKDTHSQKSTDSETENFPHDISDEDGGTRSMQKVQKEGYTSDEASKETEDITVEESAASTDKTHSSEDEVVTTASKKGRKRKQQNTRKTPRKRVAQFEWAEEDECIPSRTNTSRSSASRQTQSVVESPRPMRSSRRAAAAAIKAMAKNQDDTPPDSPPSDNDTDYSD